MQSLIRRRPLRSFSRNQIKTIRQRTWQRLARLFIRERCWSWQPHPVWCCDWTSRFERAIPWLERTRCKNYVNILKCYVVSTIWEFKSEHRWKLLKLQIIITLYRHRLMYQWLMIRSISWPRAWPFVVQHLRTWPTMAIISSGTATSNIFDNNSSY